MSLVIILFGALTVLAGLVILISPTTLFGYLKSRIEKPILHVLAVGVRLLLGALLLYLADSARFPLAIEIIGWLSIAAAMVFAVIGRDRFIRLMHRALSLPAAYSRVGGLFACAFGGFLVYAFIRT